METFRKGGKIMDEFILGIVLGAGCILMFSMPGCVESSNNKQEIIQLKAAAVESGSAYWGVDPKTGGTTFTWKHLEKKAEK
jgi:hypothetical protein